MGAGLRSGFLRSAPGLTLVVLAASSVAQIRTDGSLGAASSLTGTSVDIPASLGQQRGANLFHSFGQLSVAPGQTATFSGPNDVGRVIARVTGGEASRIDGTLGVSIPGADLFLLNPSGILFGRGGQVSVPGALTLSTAAGLGFGDGVQFRTSAGASALSPAAPVLHIFESGRTGSIRIEAEALTGGSFGTGLGHEKPLRVFGGGVAVEAAAGATVAGIRTRGGDLSIIATGDGDVSLTQDGGVASGTASGSISLARASLNAGRDRISSSPPAEVGGAVDLRGGSITLSGSELRTDTRAAAGGGISILAGGAIFLADTLLAADAQGAGAGGGILLDGQSIALRGSTLVLTRAGALGGTGAGGSIRLVSAADVSLSGSGRGFPTLSGFASVAAVGSGSGNAGSISATAGTAVSLFGSSIQSQVSGVATGGAVEVVAGGPLTLVSGSEISASNTGSGRGADVRIQADSISLSGAAQLGSETRGSGRAGDLIVTARDLTLRESGFLTTQTSGAGRGGDLTVTLGGILNAIDEGIDPLPTGITTRSGAGDGATNTGDAGTLSIAARKVELLAGSQVDSTSFSAGRGGQLTIAATESILIAGATAANVNTLFKNSGIYSSTQNNGPAAGSITINAPDASVVVDNGAIQSFSTGIGASGRVSIQARDLAVINGGVIDVSTANPRFTAPGDPDRNGTGAAGDLSIRLGGSLTLAGVNADGFESQITSSISNRALNAGGTGGGIRIDAAAVTLDGARITAEATRSFLDTGTGRTVGADAGSINVGADDNALPGRVVIRGGVVSTSSAAGGGGNISLRATELIQLTDARVTTSVGAGAGSGGNIVIDPRFIVFDSSLIQANSPGGPGGTISIVGDTLFRTVDTVIQAESGVGLNGEIRVSAPESDIAGSIAQLDNRPSTEAPLRRDGCIAARSPKGGSSLTLGSTGARTDDPEAALMASAIGGREGDAATMNRPASASRRANGTLVWANAAPCQR